MIPDAPASRPFTPWRGVLAFGFVSLFADMVYEAMRALSGPFLGSLGASALTVGIVTGAGEAMALVLRLVAGPMADRTQQHWPLVIVGYGMTAVCVPLLALAPHLGAAGLAFAVVLILLERTGKAVRSPSKSVLLASAASRVGRGKGFGVHKAMDQIGAFAGPLVAAGVVALTGVFWPAFAVLALPGVVVMVLLVVLLMRLQTDLPEPGRAPTSVREPLLVGTRHLPAAFWWFALAVAATTGGLMTFGVIGFHLADADLVPAAGVPLVYAGAMLVAAVAALVTGWAYDAFSHRVLLVLPWLVAGVPALALSGHLGLVLLGVALWGAAGGLQDSTVKALVADLVPSTNRGTAYGVFAACQGVAALTGGALAGWLYTDHLMVLAVGTALLQALALVLLVTSLHVGTDAPIPPVRGGTT